MEFATYQQYDVTQLTLEEGCDLLEKIGVKGKHDAVEQVVKKWNGHALTLTLLGSFLAGYYHGDVSCISKINPPKLDRGRDEDINQLLYQYDSQLDEAERAFLMLFSAFRIPVKQTALDPVFRTPIDDSVKTENPFLPLRTQITALEDSEFAMKLQHLGDLRLVNYHADEAHYTIHPLVKTHYFQLLNRQEPVQIQEVHHAITQYYLRTAGETSEHPTLEELRPLIEAVHHACLAREYDEAFPLLRERLNQGRYLLPEVLGAWDTYLEIMLDFFPGRDSSQELQLSEPTHQSSLLHEIGFCYMSLGRPRDAAPFYERSLTIKLQEENWIGASRSYQNLSEVHTYLGELDQSLEVAQKGFDCVREIGTVEGKEETAIRSG